MGVVVVLIVSLLVIGIMLFILVYMIKKMIEFLSEPIINTIALFIIACTIISCGKELFSVFSWGLLICEIVMIIIGFILLSIRGGKENLNGNEVKIKNNKKILDIDEEDIIVKSKKREYSSDYPIACADSEGYVYEDAYLYDCEIAYVDSDGYIYEWPDDCEIAYVDSDGYIYEWSTNCEIAYVDSDGYVYEFSDSYPIICIDANRQIYEGVYLGCDPITHITKKLMYTVAAAYVILKKKRMI